MRNRTGFMKTLVLNPGFRIAFLAPMLLLGGLATAFGAKPAPCTDMAVTTTVADVDSSGNAYTIASDGLGSYFNGVGNVMSILTCNGYNGIKNGDWQFNKPVSNRRGQRLNARNLGVSLNVSDAIQPGDPHYTAPANPPFWGTEIRYAYAEVKCTFVNQSMLAMTAETGMTCPMIFSFFTSSDAQYGLNPAHSFNNFPETTDVQISCTGADSTGCKDWVIEPIGSSQAVGRLVPNADSSNQGDFYMRFKIHVTRP